MTIRLLAVTLATTLAACASGPSGPPPYNPVGSYEFTAMVEGQNITGTMTIEADEEGYTGILRAASVPMPPAPITAVEVVDQTVTIHADGPEGPLIIAATVTETGLEGTWAMGEGTDTFTATRSN